MQKTFVTILLLGSAVATLAQGTVQFSNGALSRISLYPGGGFPPSAYINFGLFYGIGESTSLTFLSSQLGVNSTYSAGVIVNPADRKSPLNTVGIPGTTPNETDVWIQFKGWDSSFGTDWLAASIEASYLGYGVSQIRNIAALGQPTGPGVQIWQGATGTDPTRIPAFAIVPEPSTFALVGLGAAALMIVRQRK